MKLLNSDKGENQIAAGVACGLILGFAPSFSPQTLLVFVIILLFRIQIGAAFTSAFFFAMVAYLFDPMLNSVGQIALELDGLKGLYTTLYNMPIVPFTKFYNSLVMGAAIVSIVAFPFVFVGTRFLIKKYREKVVAKFQNSKFWKAVKATSFYKWYVKYDELYG